MMMGYDPEFVKPMRQELVNAGVQELTTPEEVDAALQGNQETILVLVNSVCGCAAGSARPGLIASLTHGKKPAKITTVFAGVDKEATAKAREYFTEHQPSSPSMFLLKEGKVVFALERHQIEGHSAEQIAEDLQKAFDKFC